MSKLSFVDSILGPKPGTPLHIQQRAARLRQEERDKEFWDKWKGILDNWYYRYLGATLCLWAAWYLFGLSHELPRDWLPAFYAIGAAVSAAWLARELTKWLLIGGVCIGVIIWLDGIKITPSGAILIGAIYIGWCIQNAGRIRK
jgi:hypothetical protein